MAELAPPAAATRGRVVLDRITVDYPGKQAVSEVSLEVAPGSFVCLLGPSGCGKTTTMRVIAGLVQPTAGRLLIDDADAHALPAHRRNIAMVFQDLALFPHMNVYDNVAFGLRVRKLPAPQIRERVMAVLDLLQLDGLERRLPRQLSGGQQQRVALARSLVVDPSVLLLDEPFAALDRKLREDLRRELRSLQRRLRITVLFVTHDQEEALTLADRVVVMNDGRIEQQGSPDEVYESPGTRFVLGFVGFSNFLRIASVADSAGGRSCELAGARVLLGERRLASEVGPELAIRAERIRLGSERELGTSENRLAATLVDVTYEGAAVVYEVRLADGQSVLVRSQNQGSLYRARQHSIGETVHIGWSAGDTTLLAPDLG